MNRDRTPQERAPLCRLCHARHWSREPHAFTKTKKPKKEKRR